MCITTSQTLNLMITITRMNPNANPTIKQYAIVSIQLNIVACPKYREKVIRVNIIAPFLMLPVVAVSLPALAVVLDIALGENRTRDLLIASQTPLLQVFFVFVYCRLTLTFTRTELAKRAFRCSAPSVWTSLLPSFITNTG